MQSYPSASSKTQSYWALRSTKKLYSVPPSSSQQHLARFSNIQRIQPYSALPSLPAPISCIWYCSVPQTLFSVVQSYSLRRTLFSPTQPYFGRIQFYLTSFGFIRSSTLLISIVQSYPSISSKTQSDSTLPSIKKLYAAHPSSSQQYLARFSNIQHQAALLSLTQLVSIIAQSQQILVSLAQPYAASSHFTQFYPSLLGLTQPCSAVLYFTLLMFTWYVSVLCSFIRLYCTLFIFVQSYAASLSAS